VRCTAGWHSWLTTALKVVVSFSKLDRLDFSQLFFPIFLLAVGGVARNWSLLGIVQN